MRRACVAETWKFIWWLSLCGECLCNPRSQWASRHLFPWFISVIVILDASVFLPHENARASKHGKGILDSKILGLESFVKLSVFVLGRLIAWKGFPAVTSYDMNGWCEYRYITSLSRYLAIRKSNMPKPLTKEMPQHNGNGQITESILFQNLGLVGDWEWVNIVTRIMSYGPNCSRPLQPCISKSF